jgi:hypothetical protein
MTDNMVKITVEVLNILAIATKELRQSRASELVLRLTSFETDMMALEKYLKKLATGTPLEDGMMKLDKLTSVGARMASIEVLRHIIDKKVIDVGDYARVVEEKVPSVEKEVQPLGDNTIDVVDDKGKGILGGTQLCLASYQFHR